MPKFRYKAISDNGKWLKNSIFADSLEQAKYLLSKDNIVAIEIKETKEKREALKRKDLLEFTMELSKLLKAKVPVYQALLLLEDNYRNSKHHYLIYEIIEDIKSGKQFHQALMKHKSSFSPIYISMIKNGEESATLAETLQELVNLFESHNKFKKCCISALAYPAVLLSFAVIIFFVFIFFVIPSFFDLLQDRELNGLTSTIFGISKFAISHSYIFVGSIVAPIISLILAARINKVKKLIFKLPIPFMKQFLLESALIRFSHSAHLLLRQNLPLTESLKLSIPLLNHPLLEEIIKDSITSISQGKSLSESLKQNKIIPNIFVKLISIGENSSNLDEMFKHIYMIYEQSMEKKFILIKNLLQPIVLVIIAAIVAMMIFAVMVPLTDVTTMF